VLAVVSDRKFGQQLYGYTANTTGTGTHTYNTLANEYVYVASGGNFDQTSNTTETSYDVYLPEVMSYSDYYPFGAPLPGRSSGSSDTRYGFSGKEKDNELYGDGNSYDFGARMYNPRLGRWMSVDPQQSIYPSHSPYNYALNSPLKNGDPNGEWVEVKTTRYYKDSDGNFQVKKWYQIFKKTIKVQKDIIMHNAKIYNYNQDTDTETQKAALEAKLKSDFNGTNYKWGKNKIVDDDENCTEYAEAKKLYQVTFRFQNDDGSDGIKVVDKIADVKTTGNNPDNLYVLANSDAINDWTNMPDHRRGFTLKSAPLTVLDHIAVASHELGHNLGLSHFMMSDGLHYAIRPPTDKDIKNFTQPNNGDYGGEEVIKDIKKKEEDDKAKNKD
jgi:RHS repeat-associated protein